MSYNQDWDRRLNPHRYDANGNLTESAARQDARMGLDSAGETGSPGGSRDFEVAIPALDRASRRASALRAELSKATKEPHETSHQAAGALKTESFALGPALQEVATAWDDKSRNLCAAFAKLEKALWYGARDTEMVESHTSARMSDYMKRYK